VVAGVLALLEAIHEKADALPRGLLADRGAEDCFPASVLLVAGEFNLPSPMPPKPASVPLVLVLMLRLAFPQLLALLLVVLDCCMLSPNVLRRCSPLDRGAGAGS
jgi:hypothetical protein